MRCHFPKTDANPDEWPQHVPFCFSWWQTIFRLNRTGSSLSNLKECSRWFMFLALRYKKGNTAKQTFLICSTFDLFLIDVRVHWLPPLVWAVVPPVRWAGLHSCTQHTRPLKLFALVSKRLFFSSSYPPPDELQWLSLTSEHRKASANMGNSQNLQIQLHLSKKREEKHAVNKELFPSHTKISLCICTLLALKSVG